jgi:hypothetical protein
MERKANNKQIMMKIMQKLARRKNISDPLRIIPAMHKEKPIRINQKVFRTIIFLFFRQGLKISIGYG